MALTDTALKALKPRDKTYTVTDDRGLYVEVFPTGGVVWGYRYRLNGKYEKLTLGKYPALTLKNARLKRDEAAHQVAMGESPAKKKQQEKVAGAEDATVADFAERFFKVIQSRDRKNVTHAPPLPGKGYPAAHWQQADPGHYRRGRASAASSISPSS